MPSRTWARCVLGVVLGGPKGGAERALPRRRTRGGLAAVATRGRHQRLWRPVLAQSLAHVTARRDGVLVGFVNVAWDGRDHAFLLDTRVHPDERHQRMGVSLVRMAAHAAVEAGCEVLHVDYDASLAPFYAACGFRPTQAGLLALAR
jgi:hypothetical protein